MPGLIPNTGPTQGVIARRHPQPQAAMPGREPPSPATMTSEASPPTLDSAAEALGPPPAEGSASSEALLALQTPTAPLEDGPRPQSFQTISTRAKHALRTMYPYLAAVVAPVFYFLMIQVLIILLSFAAASVGLQYMSYRQRVLFALWRSYLHLAATVLFCLVYLWCKCWYKLRYRESVTTLDPLQTLPPLLAFLLNWLGPWLRRIYDTATRAKIRTVQDVKAQDPCQGPQANADGSATDPSLDPFDENNQSCGAPSARPDESRGAEQEAAVPPTARTPPVQGESEVVQRSGSDPPQHRTRPPTPPDNDVPVATSPKISIPTSHGPPPLGDSERCYEGTVGQQKTWDLTEIDKILGSLSKQSDWDPRKIIGGQPSATVGVRVEQPDSSPPSTPTAVEDVPRRHLIQVACMLKNSCDQAVLDQKADKQRAEEKSCNQSGTLDKSEKETQLYQKKFEEERKEKEDLDAKCRQQEEELRELRNDNRIVRQARDLASRRLFASCGDIWVMLRIRDRNLGQQQGTSGVNLLNDGIGQFVPRRVGPADQPVEFHHVFPAATSNLDVFGEISPLIDAACEGANVCIIADGQSATGKTYTMLNGHQSLAYMIASRIFEARDDRQACSLPYRVGISAWEVYKNNVQVLLERDAERPVTPGSSGRPSPDEDHSGDKAVPSLSDLVDLIHLANDNRVVNSTDVNAASSRSHFICTIFLSPTHEVAGPAQTCRLSLVDLAGSEQPSMEQGGQNNSQRNEEGGHINNDREVLRRVVDGLYRGDKYIPYRDRQVTKLLQRNFKDCKILLLAHVSSSQKDQAARTSTLAFAAKMQELGRKRLIDNLQKQRNNPRKQR